MDPNIQRLMFWSATFVLMGGAVVYAGCKTAQSLVDNHEDFPHADGCRYAGEHTRRPWDDLHAILRSAQG